MIAEDPAGEPLGMIALFVTPHLFLANVFSANEVAWWVTPKGRAIISAQSTGDMGQSAQRTPGVARTAWKEKPDETASHFTVSPGIRSRSMSTRSGGCCGTPRGPCRRGAIGCIELAVGRERPPWASA
jgi:hypothetical protein